MSAHNDDKGGRTRTRCDSPDVSRPNSHDPASTSAKRGRENISRFHDQRDKPASSHRDRSQYNGTGTGTETAESKCRQDRERSVAGKTESLTSGREHHRRENDGGRRGRASQDSDSVSSRQYHSLPVSRPPRERAAADSDDVASVSSQRAHSLPVVRQPSKTATDLQQDTQRGVSSLDVTADYVREGRNREETRKKYSTPQTDQDVQLSPCLVTDVADRDNERYQSEEGQGYPEHEREDRHFAVVYKEFTLLGVFDGHDGSKASDFVSKQFPHILVQRLEKDRFYTDKQVEESLLSALREVECSFFMTLDPSISQKMSLQSELPEGLNSYEAFQQFPDVVHDLAAVSEKLAGGTTAALAVIHNHVLFAANVGDSRVLLAHCSEKGALYCRQLTVDHDCDNKDELKRLEELGLNAKVIIQSGRVGSQQCTRTLGDYSVKGGYKEFDILREAKSEPVIAEPYICGGIQLEECHQFVAVMSDGVYKTFSEATGDKESANNAICRMIHTELKKKHPDVRDVAKQVLHNLIEMHKKEFFANRNQECRKRDDMTLLVYSLQGGISTGTLV